MAFRSNGPTMLALPAFRGVTRQLILICITTFFVFWLISSFVHDAGPWLGFHFALFPEAVLHGWVWQLLTYALFPIPALLAELFALISVWYFGAALEDELGPRWFKEFFFTSVIGGAFFATLFAWASHGRAFGIITRDATAGLYPFVMALLLAYARFNADQEILLFVLRIKAKYLAAVYLLYYLGSTILGGDRFGALTAVCTALAAWLYLRFVPRRGLGFSATERWYSLRNAFYRNKRRQAAKKFEVYMREQGRDVHFDANGKFIDGEEKSKRDPNSRRWMN